MRSSLFFLLVTSSICTSFGQPLERRVRLGVAVQTFSGNTVAKHGAEITQVMEGSTAAEMKLKAGEVITGINGTKITTSLDLTNYIRNQRGANEVTLTVLSGTKTLTVSAALKTVATDTCKGIDIKYGQFTWNRNRIRTIYWKLQNQNPKATIYFLQGISCYSLDNLSALDPTRLAIKSLVKQGFAVYMVEKPGMGDSESDCNCSDLTYTQELSVYQEGYRHLIFDLKTDSAKVFLFGHSLGGIAAPLLASKIRPKGTIVYGTVFKPWSEYMLDTYTEQQHILGTDLALLRDSVELCKPSFYKLFYSSAEPDELVKDKNGKLMLRLLLEYDSNTQLLAAGRNLQFHRDLNALALTQAWKKNTSNLLALYGESDIAANKADDHIALVNYVNELRPGTANFMLVKNTNHTFQEIGKMSNYVEMQKDLKAYYQFAATRFNYRLFDTIADWINNQLTTN